MDLRSIELFAGGGGLALGLERVGVRTVCFVERDAFACATLVRQMEEGRLAPCPVWTDVATFDGRPWRGVVDLVAGGFPCQDISGAGKRVGIEGERSGLWDHFQRIVGEVRPRFVFVENVSDLAIRGLDRVAGDLAALGFDAEWGCLEAAEAGAPHGRDRLFLLAHAVSERGQVSTPGRHPAVERSRGRVDALADPEGISEREPDDETRRVATVADADLDRLEGQRVGGLRGDGDEAGRCDADRFRRPWPPAPNDASGWGEYLARWPETEPAIRRGAHGLARQVDRLRVLGNGVVPDQAALAFRTLWDRLMTASSVAEGRPASRGEE